VDEAANNDASGEATDDLDDSPTEDSPGQTALLDELLAERPAAVAEGPREPSGLRTRVGRLVTWALGQAPKVEFDGLQGGPVPARSIVPIDPTTITEAIASGRGVLLTFEDGRPDAPIITGFLQDFGDAPQIYDEPVPESNITEAEARIDGRRVELEAADEIVLRCGQASITLRRNGRVVIRGTYVESRSRGVNRIKGGSVEIN
jgi:hypothetical protein